jgi:hypothetical protein
MNAEDYRDSQDDSDSKVSTQELPSSSDQELAVKVLRLHQDRPNGTTAKSSYLYSRGKEENYRVILTAPVKNETSSILKRSLYREWKSYFVTVDKSGEILHSSPLLPVHTYNPAALGIKPDNS